MYLIEAATHAKDVVNQTVWSLLHGLNINKMMYMLLSAVLDT